MSSLMLGEAPLITLVPDGTGAQAVLASMGSTALIDNMSGDRFRYWVCTEPGTDSPVGLIGLRDGVHLYQLFVRSGRHRQGIGRRLWLHLLADWPTHWARPEHITVNASPYGLPAYLALGFRPIGVRTEMNGIAFVPMRFSFPQP